MISYSCPSSYINLFSGKLTYAIIQKHLVIPKSLTKHLSFLVKEYRHKANESSSKSRYIRMKKKSYIRV